MRYRECDVIDNVGEFIDPNFANCGVFFFFKFLRVTRRSGRTSYESTEKHFSGER